jgi:uncharacterized protein (TIGR03086 family)
LREARKTEQAGAINLGGAAVESIERIERATAFAYEKVKGVTPADMSKPTPCSEFDVRALLNHVIGGLVMLTTAAEGGRAEIPEGDQFGSDPAGVYEDRRSSLVSAIRAQGALDRNWEMPFGSMPGAMMAGIAFMEHLTHAWDIAKATGQDSTLPDDLVVQCLELVTPMDAMLRTPGVCSAAVEVPENASSQDKLIAFLGRNP